MDKKICPHCNAENKLTRYFCEKCGAFLEAENFESDVYDMQQMKIMRIVDNLRHMEPSEQVPDEAFAFHAEKVERLQALLALPEFSRNEKLGENMRDFLSLCRHPEFQIAFVGTIKTGKSTLINALLGKNYASMDVTPETAALTKFRVSPRDYVKVDFYTETEWKELWKTRHNADKFMEEYELLDAESHKHEWVGHKPIYNEVTSDEVEDELRKWSSSKSAEHYFVKEIEVGISTLAKDFPPQVVFVDTPGLFDPVSYRSDLTKKYIRRANAVFVCVDANKIQQQEIETISTVLSVSSNNKEKVHIVATHWDKLNKPEKSWPLQKEFFVRQLTGKGFFETQEIATRNILHTAAYIHILCRDYEMLDEDDRISLMQFALPYRFNVESIDDRNKMMEKANVSTIYSIIRDNLAGNYRKFLMEDVENRFIGIRHDLQRVVDDTREDAAELFAASQSELEAFKEKAEAKRKDYETIKDVSQKLNAIIDQVETNTARQMESICGQLRLKVNPAYQAPKEERKSLRKMAKRILGIK